MTHPADQHPDTPEHGAPARPAAPGEADFPGVDLDMLAYDIADLLERNGYPVDVASTHIRPALPAFLQAALASAAADDSNWEDEAMNTGAEAGGPAGGDGLLLVPDAALAHQRGRAPKMAYWPWFTSQGTEVGATAADQWYWRCPVCRVWAGPCPDRQVVNRTGADHRYDAHDRPAARRAEARVAARRVCREMTAARLDETAARLAAAHGLTVPVVIDAVHLTAEAIHGIYSSCEDALFYTGKILGTARDGDYLKDPHPLVSALVSALASELGRPGWLEDRMAARAARR